MDRRSAIKKTGVLTGSVLAIPSILSLVQSCKEQARLTWLPEFFTEEEAKTVSTLVDMILPRTETPGALDVKVDMFIDKLISKTYDTEGQQYMHDEMAAFNADCKQNFGANFIDLDEAKRIEVLKRAEKDSGKFNPGVWGKTIGNQEPIRFYRTMKSMAIWAFFTSEEIGENVLSYDPVPGAYEGCKPLSEVGYRWSL